MLLTQIYLNEALHYKSGYTVTLVPSLAAAWKAPKTNQIVVTHKTGLAEGTMIQVTITPTA